MFYSDHLSINQESQTPYEKVVRLSRIQPGEHIILKNILFKNNSFELDSSYLTELDQAVLLIKRNPKLQFEISGHTDNSGTVKYNLKLSQQRAKMVYDYFIAKGIDRKRLTYMGYGQTCPISSHNNENRRTELLVK